MYLKNIKNRSVSLRERSSLLLLFVIFVVIFAYTGKKGKRHEERNLMMSLTVRRTKNNVFVTTTARNNDKRVSIVCSLSFLSRSFSLCSSILFSLSQSLYHRIDVRIGPVFICTFSLVHSSCINNEWIFSFSDHLIYYGSLNIFNWRHLIIVGRNNIGNRLFKRDQNIDQCLFRGSARWFYWSLRFVSKYEDKKRENRAGERGKKMGPSTAK